MKIISTSIIIVLSVATCFAQYNDPNIAKPTSGYGADGTHSVAIDSLPNPAYSGKYIYVYHPSDISTKVPTIFYNHAFGGSNPAGVAGMLDFVAKKGYAIVFVPYQTIGVTISNRYDNLLNGFRLAARNYTAIIDTTRVGFLGYSFGGGAAFGNSYQCFKQNNWGQNGRFIYAFAQWYSFNITQTELQSFPTDTKLLIEICNDDAINDHRMAIDIFNNINISVSEKDFILIKSDTIAGYAYNTDHGMPNTSGAFNALDYYAYYRLLDALCDYTFNGSSAGKNVALGNGSLAQITMPGGLKNLVQSDNPTVLFPESKYLYPCSDPTNLRSAYCPVLADAEDRSYSKNDLKIYPNPASSSLTIELCPDHTAEDLNIFNVFGQLLLTDKIKNRLLIHIDLTSFPQGLYFISTGERKTKITKGIN